VRDRDDLDRLHALTKDYLEREPAQKRSAGSENELGKLVRMIRNAPNRVIQLVEKGVGRARTALTVPLFGCLRLLHRRRMDPDAQAQRC